MPVVKGGEVPVVVGVVSPVPAPVSEASGFVVGRAAVPLDEVVVSPEGRAGPVISLSDESVSSGLPSAWESPPPCVVSQRSPVGTSLFEVISGVTPVPASGSPLSRSVSSCPLGDRGAGDEGSRWLSQAAFSELEKELESPGDSSEKYLSQFERDVAESHSDAEDPLAGPLANEILALAGIPRERIYELALSCDSSWIELLEAKGPLLDHLINEPGPTWRNNFPTKRRVALGKAFEPFLAAAVSGRGAAWKALEVAMRLLYRAPTRAVGGVKALDGVDFSLDRELGRRLLLVKEPGGWGQLLREYLEELVADKRRKELRQESVEGGDGRGAKGRSCMPLCFAR